MGHDDLALFLWLRYIVETERFDRDRDAWLPHDRDAMLENARRMWAAMQRAAAELEVPKETLASQRNVAERMSFERQVELYSELERRFREHGEEPKE